MCRPWSQSLQRMWQRLCPHLKWKVTIACCWELLLGAECDEAFDTSCTDNWICTAWWSDLLRWSHTVDSCSWEGLELGAGINRILSILHTTHRLVLTKEFTGLNGEFFLAHRLHGAPSGCKWAAASCPETGVALAAVHALCELHPVQHHPQCANCLTHNNYIMLEYSTQSLKRVNRKHCTTKLKPVLPRVCMQPL